MNRVHILNFNIAIDQAYLTEEEQNHDRFDLIQIWLLQPYFLGLIYWGFGGFAQF